MLGFERKEPFVVKGKYAKRLREQLYRITTGNYNRNDILSAAAKHEKSNIKIVMKNDVICYFARWILVLFFTVLEYKYNIIQVSITGKSLKV